MFALLGQAGATWTTARNVLRRGDQASAAHPADHPAADAGAGAVAGVGSIRAV